MPQAVDSLFLSFQTALAGRYSLERELGRGGMGIVYLAREVRLDRPVAIKLLPPAQAGDAGLRRRFVAEARTAARLSHPHIIPIYAVDELDDFVFFAMAYVDGETLGQRVRARGPLPPHEAARVLREVAWALLHAHRQGIVHRDVKPDNILLERPTGRAIVTDFGIARVVETSGLTGAGELIGTPEFMSPEQASGGAVDARSDLYSLGVVGYYALTGRLPFEAATVPAVLAQQLTAPPPPLAAAAPTAPRHLAQLIDRCLSKDPAERFPTGEVLADELAVALETRRDAPAPVRAFLKSTLEMGSLGCLYAFAVVVVVPQFMLNLLGEDLLWLVFPTWVVLLGGVPVALRAVQIRRLIRAGYTAQDLAAGARVELERRREELAFEHGRGPTRLERALRAVGVAGVAVGGGLIALTATTAVTIGLGPIIALVGGGLLSLLGAVAAAQRRRDVRGERQVRLWSRGLGRWWFRLAGVGLKPGEGAAADRPTELALGRAVDALFGELPAEVRRALSDLPAVVARLEEHAQRIRARVAELDRLVAEARREPRGGVGAARREAVLADLRDARETADARLRETVAALETLRLDLLRLRAGAGSVESLTADLAAAQEIGVHTERLLAGRREAEAALGREADGLLA